MDSEQRVYPSGQHYSGRNRIPNIKQFMESLDREKKQRDAQIDVLQENKKSGEVSDHLQGGQRGKNHREVRDPVTGQDVQIADIDSSYAQGRQEPHGTYTVPSRPVLLGSLGQQAYKVNHLVDCAQRQPRQGHNCQN